MSAGDKNECDMVLRIAGADRSCDLGCDIITEAAALDGDALRVRMADAAAVLALGNTASEADYLALQLDILGQRNQIDITACELPDAAHESLPKRVVGGLRGFLWRLMRFGFEWNLFHQNVINEQQTITLAHEVRMRRRENDELRRRLELLEAKVYAEKEGEQS